MRRAWWLLAAWLLAVPAGAHAAAPPETWLVPAFDAEGVAASHTWIGEALAELITDAFQAAGLRVFDATERRALWDEYDLPASAALAHATLVRVGRDVGATRVIVGRYAVQGDTVRVQGYVLDTGEPAMGARIEALSGLDGLAAMAAQVAGRAAGRPVPLAGPLAAMPPAAVEAFVKGRVAGRLVDRLAHLDRALAIAPAFPLARLAQWELHDAQDADAAALTAVRAVPAGTPWSRAAQLRSAVSLINLGRLEEAREQLQALSRAGADAAILNNLGVVRVRLGQTPGTAFTDAARLDPGEGDIPFNAGYAAWRRGEAATALAALRDAVRVHAADAQAHYVLAQVYQALGRPVEAAAERMATQRLAEELATLEPGKAVGWERVLPDLSAPAAPRAARAVAAARAVEQQGLAAGYLARAASAMAAQHPADAVGELRRAVYLTPYDAEAQRRLAEACLTAGLPAEAVTAATLAVAAADDVASHLALARAHAAAGHAEAARAEARVVLGREPGNAEAARLNGTR